MPDSKPAGQGFGGASFSNMKQRPKLRSSFIPKSQPSFSTAGAINI